MTNPGRPDAHLITPALTILPDDQRAIITRCEVPRKQAELMRETGSRIVRPFGVSAWTHCFGPG